MGDGTKLRRFNPGKIIFLFGIALTLAAGSVIVQSGALNWGGVNRDVRTEVRESMASLKQDAHGIQEQVKWTTEGFKRIWRSVQRNPANLKTRG